MRARLSYANVVATLALFLALGGASYAALTLPRNSVGTPQLRDGSVTLPKLSFPIGTSVGTLPGPAKLGTYLDCGPECKQPAPMFQPVAHTVLDLRRRSEVLLLGSATLSEDYSPSGEPDGLDVMIVVGRAEETEQESHAQLELADGFSSSISLQRVASLSAGRHMVSIGVRGYTTRETQAESAQIVAIVLPQS